jgi:general secretion pathway protein D
MTARWLVCAACLLAGAARAQEPAPVRAVPGGGLQFDFQDADLRLVLSALAEAGHLNLVYSELPSRHITLRTNQPVPADQILPLLRSLAASNGLKITEEGSFLRIEDTGTGPVGRAAARPSAQDSAGAEVRLFVYRLKHARAIRLAGTLQSIFGGHGTNEFAGAMANANPTLSQALRDQQIQPTELPGQQPAVSVQLGRTRTPSLPGRLRGDVQIVPDEATNSLLIRAQPQDWDVLRESIVALDLRPLQVLIEVLIAEVRNTKDFQLSVAARVSDSSRSGSTLASLAGTSTGDFALRIMRIGQVNVDLALSALSSRGEVRIVSRPVLLAQNNQEARILIGSERPFVQVYRALPTDAAVRDQVVQYRDVGTQLTLTPTINDDGYVNLQLSQQVSNATAEVQFGAPVISTREASTHLFVRDGQTAVIGGLVDRDQSFTRSGIPILKDLPLLGVLFGTTTRSEVRSELFLFLTPHIVMSDEDTDRVRQGVENGAERLRPLLSQPLVDTTRAATTAPPPPKP